MITSLDFTETLQMILSDFNYFNKLIGLESKIWTVLT